MPMTSKLITLSPNNVTGQCHHNSPENEHNDVYYTKIPSPSADLNIKPTRKQH